MKLPILHVWQWHPHSGEEQKPGIAFSSKETDITVKRGTDLDSNPSGTCHSQIDMLVPVGEEGMRALNRGAWTCQSKKNAETF